MIRKFVLNSRFYVFSAYLPSVLSIFTLPIITPFLSLEDYGIYGLVYAVYSFVSILFNLGFIIEFQNSFFNEPETYVTKWSSTLGFQFCWNLIVSIPMGCILGLTLIGKVSTTVFWVNLVCFLLPFLVFEPIKAAGSRLLQYTDRHKQLFYISSVATLIQYLVVVVLVLYFQAGFVAWLIGNLLNAVLMAVPLFYYLTAAKISPKINFSFRGVRERIRKQTAIVLHNLSGYVLETSDRILLSMLNVSVSQIGVYNLGYNYANYGQTVNTALNTVFSPTYLKAVKESDDSILHAEVKRLFKFWIGLTFFISINMMIWADYVFQFLYRNEAFKGVYLIAFPIIITFVYRPFYVAVVDNLIVQSKLKYVAFISGGAAFLNVILNLIFIPHFGIKAAVYSTAFSYIFSGFVGLIVSPIRKQLTRIYVSSIYLYLSLIIVAVLCVEFMDFTPILAKLVAFVFSVIVLLLHSKVDMWRKMVLFLKLK